MEGKFKADGLWVIALAIVVMQAVLVIFVAHAIRQEGPALAKSVGHWLSKTLGHSAEATPEVHDEVAKLVSARRVRAARVAAGVLWLASGVETSGLIVQVVAGDVPYTDGVVTGGSLMLTCMIMSLLRHRLVFEHSLPVWHIVCMVILCVSEFLEVPCEIHDPHTLRVAAHSMLIGMMCLRFGLIVISNVGLTICVCLDAYTRSKSDNPSIEYSICTEVLAMVVKVAIFFSLDFILQVWTEREVRARIGKCQSSAISALLALMCDTVVDLDHNWLLKDHCAKLASLLMHGSGKSLMGSSLADFMPNSEDRSRFEEALRQGRGESGSTTPGMLTLRMRDSIGNTLKVVLYHVPYDTINGLTHHLVGLREDTEDGWHGNGSPDCMGGGGLAFATVTSDQSLANDNGPRRTALPDAILRPEIAELLADNEFTSISPVGNGGASPGGGMVHRTSHRKSSSRGSRSERPDPNLSVEVYVDADLPVRWVAPGFRREFGLEESAPFDNFGDVLPDRGHGLLARLQEVVDTFLLDGNIRNRVIELGCMEILQVQKGHQEVVRRMASVCVPAPLCKDETSRYLVSIAMHRGDRSVAPAEPNGRGTPAVIVPRPLVDVTPVPDRPTFLSI